MFGTNLIPLIHWYPSLSGFTAFFPPKESLLLPKETGNPVCILTNLTHQSCSRATLFLPYFFEGFYVGTLMSPIPSPDGGGSAWPNPWCHIHCHPGLPFPALSNPAFRTHRFFPLTYISLYIEGNVKGILLAMLEYLGSLPFCSKVYQTKTSEKITDAITCYAWKTEIKEEYISKIQKLFEWLWQPTK